ncbi:hypothetical protein ACLB2K_044933 [Fragaria x ananassa]
MCLMTMHCRGWRSVHCMPLRPAFKGSAPINLSDRLRQVLRWAHGSVKIFLSRHCPLWYGFSGDRLKWLQRLAYINTIVYPFTPLSHHLLFIACNMSSHRKIHLPTLSNLASVLFLGVFFSIILTSVIELQWSGIQDLWRNEQFWVIGGVSAHLFAVFQVLLKMLAGVDTNFTVTTKAAEDAESHGTPKPDSNHCCSVVNSVGLCLLSCLGQDKSIHARGAKEIRTQVLAMMINALSLNLQLPTNSLYFKCTCSFCCGATTLGRQGRSFAEACGVRAARVTKNKDLKTAIQKMLDTPGPYLLDVIVPHQEHVLPMIPSAGAFKDVITEGDGGRSYRVP